MHDRTFWSVLQGSLGTIHLILMALGGPHDPVVLGFHPCIPEIIPGVSPNFYVSHVITSLKKTVGRPNRRKALLRLRNQFYGEYENTAPQEGRWCHRQ